MPIEAAVVETKGKGGEGRVPDVEPGGQAGDQSGGTNP